MWSLTISSRHEGHIQQDMGGFELSQASPRESTQSLCLSVVSSFHSGENTSSCCGQAAAAAGSYLRPAEPCGTPQLGQWQGSAWSPHTVAGCRRQQLAPGEWRWTGHIHNLHKSVMGNKTHKPYGCALGLSQAWPFLVQWSKWWLFWKWCSFTAVSSWPALSREERRKMPIWWWMKSEE